LISKKTFINYLKSYRSDFHYIKITMQKIVSLKYLHFSCIHNKIFNSIVFNRLLPPYYAHMKRIVRNK